MPLGLDVARRARKLQISRQRAQTHSPTRTTQIATTPKRSSAGIEKQSGGSVAACSPAESLRSPNSGDQDIRASSYSRRLSVPVELGLLAYACGRSPSFVRRLLCAGGQRPRRHRRASWRDELVPLRRLWPGPWLSGRTGDARRSAEAMQGRLYRCGMKRACAAFSIDLTKPLRSPTATRCGRRTRPR
jgi:hypothetical protein